MKIDRDENHVYRVMEEDWTVPVFFPSVTEIIRGVGLAQSYSSVPSDVMESAAQRGTFVHEMIDLWFEGALDVESIDPRLKGYFDSFLKWADGRTLETFGTETYVAHIGLRYAGQLDWYGKKDGVITVIDWKTRRFQPSDQEQLGAYVGALVDQGMLARTPGQAMVVSLNENGDEATEHPTDFIHGFYLFESAVKIYYARRERGLL